MKGFVVAVALVVSVACGGSARDAHEGAPRTGAAVPAPALRLPSDITPHKQRIDLTLIPDNDVFHGVTDIEVTLEKATSLIWLHGTRLTVKKATVEIDGSSYPLKQVQTSGEDFLGFSLPAPVGPAPARIHIEYDGLVDDKDFLGIFRQKEEQRYYAFTQFEAIGARRAFPSFDEPRWKIPYTLTLRVPSEQIAAANTAIVSQETDPASNLKIVKFAETKPLPSYLVAFTVGPFDVVDLGTFGKNNIPLRILTPAGKAQETAYAAQVTGPILEELENYFDRAYPYSKLDSVAVPHFLGAMENPGLVTYASGLLLAKPGEDTARSKRSYANVCAHELAHQWFGNLVTLAWWDDLWLNEAFATWLSGKVVTKWQPDWEGDISRAGSQNGAMRSDSLISARKIRQPITANHDIFNAFDGVTYGKGAAVLAMFESWLGEDIFRSAVRDYMARHAHGTATAKDFLAAVARASNDEVPKAFATFLDQPGVPLINLALSCEGKKASLQYSQERFLPQGSDGDAQASTWQVPLCVKYGSGKTVTRQCTLLEQQSGTVELTGGCPKWLLGNEGSIGYYRVNYQGDLLGKLLAVESKLSVPERIGVIGNLRALVTAGKADLGQALALSQKLARDPKRQIVEQAVGIAASVEDMVPEELRANYERFVQKSFGPSARRLGFLHKKGDGDDTRLLRASLIDLVARHDISLQKQALALTLGYLEQKNSLPADMREPVLETAAYAGDAELYQTLLSAAKTESDREHRELLIDAVASFQGPKQIQQNLDMFMASDFDFRESMSLIYAPLREPAHREQVWGFVQTRYDALAQKLPKFWGKSLIYTVSAFCDEPHRAEAEAFFKNKVESIPGGPRTFANAMEDMKLCIAYRAAQTPSLVTFLGKF